jgi:spore coat protein U-like protein
MRMVLCCLGIALPSCAEAACSVSATGVAFGIYDSTSASPRDATGSITVSCTILSGLFGYDVSLSTGSSGTYANRRMTAGSSNLNYQIYADAARTQVWGNGSGGTTSVGGSSLVTNLGGTVTHQVYGRIPAGLVTSAGTYSDTIIVTVTY